MISLRKLLDATLLAALVMSGYSASAKEAARKANSPFGRSGCGLGSMIIEEKDKTSQIFASLINTYIGFVSSAITSGTSNCNHTNETAQLEQKVYISSNLRKLESDAATGNGPYLSALGALFGCDEAEDLSAFFEFNKNEYGRIYNGGDPDKVFQQLKEAARVNAGVTSHCPGLG
jgi:hypothetical protein